jgi:hypothetical protein
MKKSYIVNGEIPIHENTQSALRKEQGWTLSLRCCQRQATQVCMTVN